jgi:hypothetical protein
MKRMKWNENKISFRIFNDWYSDSAFFILIYSYEDYAWSLIFHFIRRIIFRFVISFLIFISISAIFSSVLRKKFSDIINFIVTDWFRSYNIIRLFYQIEKIYIVALSFFFFLIFISVLNSDFYLISGSYLIFCLISYLISCLIFGFYLIALFLLSVLMAPDRFTFLKNNLSSISLSISL